jgi:DNA-binding response OmpR family regulator
MRHARGGGRRVAEAGPLVVVAEDDPEVRNLVLHWLNRKGFSVEGVADGTKALELVRARHPAAVVLDWVMPGIEGHELCRLLKEDPETEHIPIVMLTARGKESDVRAAFEHGADEYLTKPFDMEELHHLLSALIASD